MQNYHPDKFKGTEQEALRITKLIKNSYDVLIDPIKRAEHDSWISKKETEATKQQSEKTQFNEAGEATERHHYQKQDTQREYTPPPSFEAKPPKPIRIFFNLCILLCSWLMWSQNVAKILWGPVGLKYLEDNGNLPFLLMMVIFHYLYFRTKLTKFYNSNPLVKNNISAIFSISCIFTKTMFLPYFITE